jgi:hypothetical protein
VPDDEAVPDDDAVVEEADFDELPHAANATRATTAAAAGSRRL